VEAKALADVFECVGISPTDADGFLGEGEDLLLAVVELVLGVNPGELVWKEIFADKRAFVDLDSGEYCAHMDF
jgi:hypothetical protein